VQSARAYGALQSVFRRATRPAQHDRTYRKSPCSRSGTGRQCCARLRVSCRSRVWGCRPPNLCCEQWSIEDVGLPRRIAEQSRCPFEIAVAITRTGCSATTLRAISLGEDRAARLKRLRSAGRPGTQSPVHIQQRRRLHYFRISSAAERTALGTFKPSVRAVLRLIMVSNLVGGSTGSSIGLAPFSIRPT